MTKLKTIIISTAMLFSAGCVGGSLVDTRSLLDVNSQGFKEFCADRDVVKTFENRIIDTTSIAEGKLAAVNTLIGPATIPIAGIESLGVGFKNIYNGFFNSEQSKADDKRCEGVE